MALSRLGEDPNLVLRNLKGLIIVDEVQRLPNLFPLLRVLSDRRPRPARFLVLGSTSPNLLRQSSESLAGRINYYELNGLGLDETGNDRLARRWLRAGLVHYLLGIGDDRSLDVHPGRGGTWEGLILELAMEQLRGTGREFYYWRTHTGAELDLFAPSGRERLGIEVKLSSAPAITPSMRHAVNDLELTDLVVVHAGEASYPMGDRIRAVPAKLLLTNL